MNGREPGPAADDPPERIVSLAPSTTEILCALGAGARLVAVSEYCDEPEVAGLPRVSRFIDADEDAIVALRPDLVITSSHLQTSIVTRLIDRDLPVLALNPIDLDGVFRDMLLLGRLVGALGEAGEIVAGLSARVAAVSAAGAGLPVHPRVYLEEWGKPLIPAGWWLAQFIKLAGGVPALPEIDPRRHSRERVVTPEAVAAADPDVIVVSWPGVRNDAPRRRVHRRPEWQHIAAVRRGHVYQVDDRILHRPSPRAVEGLEALASIMQAVAADLAAAARGGPRGASGAR